MYQGLTSLWFVSAVWLYFYRLFITDQQVGFLDGMAFAIGLLAEVPSGALADTFGRDRVVRLGQLLAGCGLILQALGSSFLPLFIGQAIMMIGVSLVSGADEALFFERLKFKRVSKTWRKLVTRGSQVSLIATVCATLVGGWLHTVNPRLPWILNGISFVLAAMIIWPVTDTRVRLARKPFRQEVGAYLDDIKTGFGQFRHSSLLLYVPLIFTVQGLFYTTDYGLLRLILLDRFHFNSFWGAVTIASSALITVGLLAYVHKHAERLSEKTMLTTIALTAASGLLLALGNIGAWGYLVILVLYAGEHILSPFMSEILNYKAPERQRATVLSVASFFKTLPYVGLAPVIGYLNTHNQLPYFLVVWALCIVAALAFYLLVKKRDVQLPVPEALD